MYHAFLRMPLPRASTPRVVCSRDTTHGTFPVRRSNDAVVTTRLQGAHRPQAASVRKVSWACIAACVFAALFGPARNAAATRATGPEILYIDGASSGYGWRMNSDGTQRVRFTNYPIANASWYDSNTALVQATHGGIKGIFLAPLAGGAPTLVKAMNPATSNAMLSGAFLSPAAAPDGNFWIAFTDYVPGSPYQSLFVVSPDGSTTIPLVNNVGYSTPTWSPDARRILVAHQTVDLDVLDLDSPGGLLHVAAATSLYYYVPGSPLPRNTTVVRPQWGKTGSSVVFAAKLPGQASYDIWKMDVNNPLGAMRLTNTPTINDITPTFSPGDTEIAFRTLIGGKNRIVKMPASGGSYTLLSGGTVDTFPVWMR